MACQAVHTGQRFVAETIAHIDCQAQAIGTYGYGALSDPASIVSIALTGLLVVFVAIFGLRLLMGEQIGSRDVISDVLRIGIVLTLATSWPAWRTIGYDVVMNGPQELASAIGGASSLPGTKGDMTSRLQAADDGIVVLTVYGTGRNTGGENRSDSIGDSFRGIALPDTEGMANGRIAFLAGILGPLAIIRLGAGLLLALAPLMAGLLLFTGARDLFFGWLRSLGALALGGLALTVIFSVQLAILEPWLRDAVALRDAQLLTPSAPTELNVITYSFLLVSLGLLLLIGKIAFFGGFSMPRFWQQWQQSPTVDRRTDALPGAHVGGNAPSRAFVVAEAVAQNVRREERMAGVNRNIEPQSLDRTGSRGEATNAGAPAYQPLGSSFRESETRRYRRNSSSGTKRDGKQ